MVLVRLLWEQMVLSSEMEQHKLLLVQQLGFQLQWLLHLDNINRVKER